MTCSQESSIVVVDSSRLNHLDENFAAAAGVEEKDSGTLLRASSVLENCCFSAFSDMEYNSPVGNRCAGFIDVKYI